MFFIERVDIQRNWAPARNERLGCHLNACQFDFKNGSSGRSLASLNAFPPNPSGTEGSGKLAAEESVVIGN